MKKQIIVVFMLLFSVPVAFSQSNIQTAHSCFNSGDYNGAIDIYNHVFRTEQGKNKRIAEIKRNTAQQCLALLEAANSAFNKKNYTLAKDKYQLVLDKNPKDRYAKTQRDKCSALLQPITLRKASERDIADIWDNKYGVASQRSKNLIAAGIDPVDAQKRINAGEGKPQTKQATYIKLSKKTAVFTSEGKGVEKVMVYSDADTYSVPSAYVPSWCHVVTYNNYFTISVSPNPYGRSRKDWFKVKSGNQEARVYVEQFSGIISKEKKQKRHRPFNPPKSHDFWGITFGYCQQVTRDAFMYGIKFEPLFKAGFAINTGINILRYSDMDVTIVNVPLHLEYRLNFAKAFNVFAYGGLGFNVMINDSFKGPYMIPVTYEYGAGMRIGHVQLNVGSSIIAAYIDDYKGTESFGAYMGSYRMWVFSVSFMF